MNAKKLLALSLACTLTLGLSGLRRRPGRPIFQLPQRRL